MKPFLEQIEFSKDASFQMIHTPNLNDTFYWHYHPEIELVYVKSPQGIRHIGSHFSFYQSSDLVFIGSNIPHLNFDYGVENKVDTIVIHFPSNFFDRFKYHTPEFLLFDTLLHKANKGAAFYGKTKEKVGVLLEELSALNSYQQFIKLLEILGILAQSEELELLDVHAIKTDKILKTQLRIQKVFHWVEENYTTEIRIDQAAKEVNLTPIAFSRWFKVQTGTNFINYVNDQRIYHAKNLLLNGKNVSEACYSCGFNNLSYFNRVFKKAVSCSPKDYKKTMKFS